MMPYYKYDSERKPYQTLPLNVVLHDRNDFSDTTLAVVAHNHESLEINAVRSGTMYFTVEDREYCLNAGDAILCNPFLVHSGRWAADCTRGEFIGFTIVLNSLMTYSSSPLNEASAALLEDRGRFDEFYPAGDSRLFSCIEAIYDAYTNQSCANECRTLRLTAYHTVKSDLFKAYHIGVKDASALVVAGIYVVVPHKMIVKVKAVAGELSLLPFFKSCNVFRNA